MKPSAQFADVAVPLPIFQTFVYSIPDSLKDRLQPGSRVFVPFGSRHLTGITVRFHDDAPEGKVKAVCELLDEQPLLSPQQLELGLWIASYYFAPPGEALRVMLPPGLLAKSVSAKEASHERRLWPGKRLLAIVGVIPGKMGLTPKQKEAITKLSQKRLPILLQEFCRKAGCSQAVLRALTAKGVVRVERIDVYRSPWSSNESLQSGWRVKKHALTEDQRRIFEKVKGYLSANQFHSMLIHGVTGSGKTEIYLNAIAWALRCGKSALMLVPEIGLTPQVSRYFRSWFGEEVAILHSALSEGERFDQWRRIKQGEARVVVGTRSAVFAPVGNLGIIIVDEEHDSSYKQEELPRYHARDTALKRGQIEGAVVVLGSATPQLETFYQAVKKGRMDYQSLPTRILERTLPEVQVADMRVEFQRHGKAAILSDLLKQSISERLRRKEQVLVLLNRRGYSSALLCRSCGFTEVCEDCSISLTYHRDLNRLSCHYCGYSRSVPTRCRQCGKEYIYFVGEGTEQIQEILGKLFPEAAIDRLDRDTVRRKGSLERILGAFASGLTDILIGTQMIAKGHDFPRVTLVGVLAAEQALRLGDFRAAERTFQLLTQVAGRAGRGDQPGQVVIQTYYPNHYSLKSACAQHYQTFFEKEIQFRRHFRYPPFTALANLLVQGKRQDRTRRLSERVMSLLLHHRDCFSSGNRMRILGPAPAARERLKGEYRFQIVIKTTNRQELHEVLSHTIKDLRKRRTSLKKIIVDIDPLSML